MCGKHVNSPNYVPMKIPKLGSRHAHEYLSTTSIMTENPSFFLNKYVPGFSWKKGENCEITPENLVLSGTRPLTLSFTGQGIYPAATGDGLIFLGLSSGQVISWDGKRKKCSESSHCSKIQCLTFCNGWVISVSRETVIVHDRDLRTLKNFPISQVACAVTLSPSKDYILLTDSVGRLSFVSTDTWIEFYSVLTRIQNIFTVRVLPSGNIVVGDGENIDALTLVDFQLPFINYIGILVNLIYKLARGPIRDPRIFRKILTYLV